MEKKFGKNLILLSLAAVSVLFASSYVLKADNPTPLDDAVVVSELPAGSVSGDVLGEKDENPIFFTVNVPSRFKKDISAPNIVYSVSGNTGIEVTEGQHPTIINTGVLSLQGLTGDLLLQGGNGISISGLEISNTLSFIGSGGTSITKVGDIITVSSSAPDYTLSGWTKVGTSVGLTTVTDSVIIDTLTFGNATVTNGKSIKPDTDLGSDLGSASLRFNNLYVGNINSNSSTSTAGQATFTYESLSTALTEASVLINPTAPVANGQLLGLSVAGYQRSLIDEDGDLTLGYNDAISAPASDYPLSVYGHNGTNVSFINTSGDAYFAGEVGIGTDAPGYQLHIVNDSIAQLRLETTSSTDPSITNYKTGAGQLLIGLERSQAGYMAIGTLANAGVISHQQAKPIQFATSNNVRMTVSSSGNVGIGITTPEAALHTYEGYGFGDTSLREQIIVQRFSGTYLGVGGGGSILFKNRNNNNSDFLESGEIGVINTQQADDDTQPAIVFHTGNAGALSEAMRLTYDGKLGIGTTPDSALDVVGDIAFTGEIKLSASRSINTDWNVNATGNTLNLYGNGTLGFYNSGTIETNSDGDLTLSPDGTGDLIIDNGYVGIGRTDPTYKLDVNGDARIYSNAVINGASALYSNNALSVYRGSTPAGIIVNTSSSSTTLAGSYDLPEIMIQNSDTTVNNWTKFYFGSSRTDTANVQAAIGVQNILHGASGISGKGDIAFFTRNTTSFDEKMRITHDGKVGIGTDTPGYDLEVNGVANITNSLRVGSGANQVSMITLSPTSYNPTMGADATGMVFDSRSAGRSMRFNIDSATVATFSTAGNLGIGVVTAGARLESRSTTEQLRLSYDASNKASMTVDASGHLTIDPDGVVYMKGNIYMNNGTTPVIYSGSTANTLTLWGASQNGGTAISMGPAAPVSGTINVTTTGVITNPTFSSNAGVGDFVALHINPTINQSGTATGGYTALKVNAIETAVLGTSTYLADFQTGGISKMNLASDGTAKIGQLTFYGSNGNISSYGGGNKFLSLRSSDLGSQLSLDAGNGNSRLEFRTSGQYEWSIGHNPDDELIVDYMGATVGGGVFIVKGNSPQSVNLQEWQDSTTSIKLSVAPAGLLNASVAGVATYAKPGTISDTDFNDTAVDGLMGVDSTNGRLYFRHSGAWHYVAQTAGFQIPEYETYTYDFNTSSFDTTSPLANGDFLIPFVEGRMSDGAIHGLYTSFSDVKDQLFADELSRILSLEERVTALEAGGGLTTNPLLASSGSIGSIATWTDTLWTFLGNVSFNGSVILPADTAGTITIPAGSQETYVAFTAPYDGVPVVTTSILSDSTSAPAVLGQKSSYAITNIGVNGFTISLLDPAIVDTSFSWIAILTQ